MAKTRTYYKYTCEYKDFANKTISKRVILGFDLEDLGRIPYNATAFILARVKVEQKKQLFGKRVKVTETPCEYKSYMIGTYLTRQEIIDTFGKDSPEYQFILEEEAALRAHPRTIVSKRFNNGLPITRDPVTGLYHYDGWYLLRNDKFAYGYGYTCNLLDKKLIDSQGFIDSAVQTSGSTPYNDSTSDEEFYSDDEEDIPDLEL